MQAPEHAEGRFLANEKTASALRRWGEPPSARQDLNLRPLDPQRITTHSKVVNLCFTNGGDARDHLSVSARPPATRTVDVSGCGQTSFGLEQPPSYRAACSGNYSAAGVGLGTAGPQTTDPSDDVP